MHQASILFSALVMAMAAAWVAMNELSGQEASAAEPAAASVQAQ